VIPAHDEPLRRSLARLVALLHRDCACAWHVAAIGALVETEQWEYLRGVVL
jgi:hypothetical protein